MKRFVTVVLAAALAAAPLAGAALAQGKELFIPLLVYRTGPYAPSGIPIANGFVDYFTLLNERDGGINGVKIAWEECETQYDTKQGVECYERLKGRGAALVNPYSTGITYQLIPKAPVDKVPVFSMGYGMSASSDGRWFPWVFNFPTNYWSQASAVIRYIGQEEGERQPHQPWPDTDLGAAPDRRRVEDRVGCRVDPPPGGAGQVGGQSRVGLAEGELLLIAGDRTGARAGAGAVLAVQHHRHPISTRPGGGSVGHEGV